jgi:DNA helicase-2/ATP-dependent DNA helicase PcrA
MNPKLSQPSFNFNNNQQKAYEWNEGPLLVIAGPGSGKTTVLTERIIRLLNESSGERFRILSLTFTKKAADNMRSRIDRSLVEERERATLATFHAFCTDVIRQHGDIADIRTDFGIMTEELDRQELLLEVIYDLAKKEYGFEKEDVRLLPKITSFMEQCLFLEKAPAPDSDLNRVKVLFFHYLERMRSTGRIDYPGILYFAWFILGNKHISKHYHVVYKYICVDEYQDTNLAQYNILERLVPPDAPNLFVVADDDQILYQWNGASPERLSQIKETYKMKVLPLPENYRCPGEVVEIANRMIKRNTSRFEVREPGISYSNNQKGDVVRLKSFESDQDELQWIALDIKTNKRMPADTVIMGRTRKLLESAQVVLEQSGIPSVIQQRKNEFESSPLRFVHALLRMLVSRGEKVQLQRLSAAFFRLEGINIDIHETIGTAALEGGDLLKAWVRLALSRKETAVNTRDYLSAISFDRDLVDFYSLIDRSFAWINAIRVSDNPELMKEFDEYMQEKEAWDRLQQEIDSQSQSDITLSTFLQELDLRDKGKPVPFGAYELITIHGAKGLEFKHVYLIGMVEDILPSYNSTKSDARPEFLEEERRACYVAITRTQGTLTMTYAKRYNGWSKQPSRFLNEMQLLQ